MKFLLIMQMNRDVWESMPEAERTEVVTGHGDFMKMITESGELISTHALADPANSNVVRSLDGVMSVKPGPYQETKNYMGGYYLVDCESTERAVELASQIPDARVDGLAVEVRPVMFSSGSDM
ncbi:YciI family protein [Streptosporangium sp. NPDC051023]|uniref:YciI family protein n=1 Tax=Streptosporangium sp. NPDC051023 TaxID=3155410 RepID=UPI003450BC63